MTEKLIRIGGASGFWGDSDHGPEQLVRRARVDYIVFDYMAELTMSILAKSRSRSPELGYATDFISTMGKYLHEIVDQGVKVLANAGGLNPRACAEALEALARRENVPLRIAYIEGDDAIDQIEAFRAAGVTDMGSGLPIPEKMLSINAYLGARPVAEALAQGAQVVITGRSVDSALALGALVHEFGWSFDDYDKLSAGSLVGHLLECGAQATGGLHTDWQDVERWEDIGYPIAECRADGVVWMTKPEGTGGLVNPAVIGEQLLYEIGDPAAYALPDVLCDFRAVTTTAAGHNRVEVAGARGRPPSGNYKMTGTFVDGYKISVQMTIMGIDAALKAERTGEALLARVRRFLRERNIGDFTEVLVELLGAESSYGPHRRAQHTREVVLRVTARHSDKAALDLLAREVAQAGTSWSPGTTGAGKRASPSELVRLFSFIWPAERLVTRAVVAGDAFDVPAPRGIPTGQDPAPMEDPEPTAAAAMLSGPRETVPLVRLAWVRSGDKGDISNLGVIARSPQALEFLRAELTPKRVKDYFSHLVKGEVRRYDLPGLGAFNFTMEQALAGGGMASLRNDPLGKGMGQMLLDIELDAPTALLESL